MTVPNTKLGSVADTSTADRFPWPAASATGIGSMPGTDHAEAMRIILGELPDLPHLAELPSRGAGADLTGRTAALLVDLPVETTAGGEGGGGRAPTRRQPTPRRRPLPPPPRGARRRRRHGGGRRRRDVGGGLEHSKAAVILQQL